MPGTVAQFRAFRQNSTNPCATPVPGDDEHLVPARRADRTTSGSAWSACDDVICGPGGDDLLTADNGEDVLNGGPGFDACPLTEVLILCP